MHSFLNLFHAAIVKKSLKYVDPKVELWIKKPLKDALREKKWYSELFWSAFSPHFPAFGVNTEIYSVSRYLLQDLNNNFCSHITVSPNLRKCWQNADQNNSEYGLFLRSDVPDCEGDSREEGKQGK